MRVVGIAIIFFLSFISSMFCVNEKTGMNLEMYECGIEPIQEDKAPFCMHFFLVGVLFLLFDVELIVCIPMVWMSVYEKVWGLLWFVFFFIIFVGLVLEMVMGTFDWKE
uniref:NADH-ubiquinone oxidoreductase chain 3 n=1 Tax=Campanulotes compar TaxID=135595 RepID=A0A386JNA4_9NEOP|nr:NADH dehydrogenase subunit 3 [Campanulotes compar]AYD72942.1 NADH dehydrogenase subunit 3 [Campanulotes compar]